VVGVEQSGDAHREAVSPNEIAISRRSATNQLEEMSKPAFKIGQSLFYRKGRMKESGRYVVLTVFPPTRGEVRYRIRSCDDESLEYIVFERELGTA
jgi:hypothetical protein